MSSLVAEAVLDEASLFLLRDGEGIEWRSILLGIPRALSCLCRCARHSGESFPGAQPHALGWLLGTVRKCSEGRSRGSDQPSPPRRGT